MQAKLLMTNSTKRNNLNDCGDLQIQIECVGVFAQ